MSSDWQAFLLRRGARIEAGVVGDFGDPAAELRAARDGAIIAPLTHLGLIACSGADAQSFLHGQLSNDVKQLAPGRSEYAAYCSAKGRMLANMLLWRESDAYFLQLARSLQPLLQKRLGMFILRAKVALADASDARPLIGLAGRAAVAALKELFPVLPQQPHQLVHDPVNGTLIALPGGRFQLAASLDAPERLWDKLAASMQPVGAACWEWLELRAPPPHFRAG